MRGGQALVSVVAQFLEVIHHANHSKHQGKQEHIQVFVVSCQQIIPSGYHDSSADRQNEHNAAHSGGTLLGHMPSGAVFPDRLPGLEPAQKRNQ